MNALRDRIKTIDTPQLMDMLREFDRRGADQGKLPVDEVTVCNAVEMELEHRIIDPKTLTEEELLNWPDTTGGFIKFLEAKLAEAKEG